MIAWAYWLGGIVLSFAVFESFAIITRRIPTLSRTTVRLCQVYPLLACVLGLLAGLLVGGLAVHFFGWTPDKWC